MHKNIIVLINLDHMATASTIHERSFSNEGIECIFGKQFTPRSNQMI
jgi:hypothetical protein